MRHQRRRRLWPGLRRAVLCCLAAPMIASPAIAAAPTIVSTTFLGGALDEDVVSVALMADGSVVLALRAMTPKVKNQHVESVVMRLDKSARTVSWKTPLPAEVTLVVVDGSGAILAAAGKKVHRLEAATGAIAASSEELPGDVKELSAGASELVVIAGNGVTRLGAEKLDQLGRVTINNKNLTGLQIDNAGGFYVSGDTVSNTGCEPYRVPYIYHYNNAGERDWLFYDYPAALVRLDRAALQADTQIRFLRGDRKGRLWFTAQSDGYNTVLTQKNWHMKEQNPFLWEGCFPSPCRWYDGAKLIRMAGRISDTYDEVARGTWWVPYARKPNTSRTPEFFDTWEKKYGACGCRDDRWWRPVSSWIQGLAFGDDEVVLFGGGDSLADGQPATPPTTADAWFGVPKGGSHYVAVLDEDLKAARFAAALPALTGIRADVRGGRMVLAGGAYDGKTKMHAELPMKDALQSQFGGGDKDGFVMVTCLDPGSACDGALPAAPLPKPPVIRPPVEWPKISACVKRGAGMDGADLVSGTLPPQVDYSTAPKTPPSSGRIEEDGGAVAGDGGVRVDGGTPTQDAAPAGRPVDAGSSTMRRDARAPAPDEEPVVPTPPRATRGCSVGQGAGGIGLPLLAAFLFLLRRGKRAR